MSDLPRLTAYRWVPPMAQGLVRDLRVRWAFEEVGQPYAVDLIELPEAKLPPHRRLQPFGQVPALVHGDLTLFESGAIVLYIARTWPGLLPDDAAGAARATEWMFAALNSVEPRILDLQAVLLFERDQPWSEMRRPTVMQNLAGRLDDLATALGDREWLSDDRFTAGDLMMIGVLRPLSRNGRLAEHPSLAAYCARGEARPAFARALASQMGDFEQRAA